jgi:hypothetical protein
VYGTVSLGRGSEPVGGVGGGSVSPGVAVEPGDAPVGHPASADADGTARKSRRFVPGASARTSMVSWTIITMSRRYADRTGRGGRRTTGGVRRVTAGAVRGRATTVL